MTLDAVLSRIDETLPDAMERLFGLLRIASISTDPAYRAECAKAADWLAAELKGLGFEAAVRPTPGHPMVVAHGGGTAAEGPHLLFYGHYDVQPVDPLALWNRDPFDPAIEETAAGQVIRGRGASDDKGQLMTFIEACRAWKAVHGTLPGRLTIFLEGEEESGSPSLIPFMKENAGELTADLALICDTSMVARGVPSIASQLRGMLKDEFTLHGPRIDLHSGHYGGPGLNPLREMARIVASFHDPETGRVAVEGFYEGVHEVPEDLLRQWQSCGFDEAEYLSSVGYSVPHGEKGYSALEQQWARPTLEINGLWGGYQGAGSKTVIPAEAHCKLTCRLVGDMDPDKLRARVRAHVEARLAPDCTVTWDNDLEGSPAAVMNTARPEFEAARQALSDEWQREAVFVGMGDPDKPRFVFFFDEAHLLFEDSPKALIDKVEQVARLIRSKGVGVYFITQNPADVPDDILGQLGNRVQHALRAFTARDQKDLARAAQNYRANPAFDTETAIKEVGTGEAVTSFLQAKGAPGMVERTLVRPPASQLGPISSAERRAVMAATGLGAKYDTAIDRDSAFERLKVRAEAAAKEAQKAEAEEAQMKEELAELRRARRYDAERAAPRRTGTSRRASRSDSLAVTFGKSLARQLGTRSGQALVRGILGSLFKSR